MIQVGSYSLVPVEAERFRLDGGAMFGVVPKPLWNRSHPADEKNRIQMVTRCLLLRGEGRVIIVDTGMGDDWSEKERAIYAIENGEASIVPALARHGVLPEAVTDVVLTHLHFDHVGGAVRREKDRFVPVFPRARYHTQRSHLDWAIEPTPRDRRSFRPDDFMPLKAEGLFELAEGESEILPGIHVTPTVGHTVGHQIVRIGEGSGAIVHCGDLIPTAAHVAEPWVMSFDLQPITTMKEKRELLGRAAAQSWILVMEHDPGTPAVTVGREGDSYVVAEAVELGRE
jgi:glyoxylase-like metal-dependent hydrolase (beta-lactamase superfamily II)